MKQVRLATIERDIRREFRKDGLNIVFLGIALALAAVFFLDIRHGWVFGMAVVIYTQGPHLMRKYAIYPRTGFVKFHPVIHKPIHHAFTLAAAIIGIALLYLFGKNIHYNWLMPLYLGVVFALLYFIIARVNGSPVDYFVSVLFIVSGLIGTHYTRQGFEPAAVTAIQLWALSVAFIVIGVIMLIRFLGNIRTTIRNDSTSERNVAC